MENTLDRLKTGATSQVTVMKTLSKDLISPFNNTLSQLNSVGKNAIAGLNAGLNMGGVRAIASARRIANSIASAMKSTLKIHSPSHLMRDDAGKMTPAGVAVGIEENAGIVYKALDRLSSGMILSSTYEVALGIGSMARNTKRYKVYPLK